MNVETEQRSTEISSAQRDLCCVKQVTITTETVNQSESELVICGI